MTRRALLAALLGADAGVTVTVYARAGELDLERTVTLATRGRDQPAPLSASPRRQLIRPWSETPDAADPVTPGALSPETVAELNAAVNDYGPDGRARWLDRFGVKPTELDPARLDEARRFIAEALSREEPF